MSKWTLFFMAERTGFEPAVRLLAHTLSKRAPSTTRTPLLVGAHSYPSHFITELCKTHALTVAEGGDSPL